MPAFKLSSKIVTEDGNLVALIFNDTQPNIDGSPWIHQPFNPETGKPFQDKTDAQSFIDQFQKDHEEEVARLEALADPVK